MQGHVRPERFQSISAIKVLTGTEDLRAVAAPQVERRLQALRSREGSRWAKLKGCRQRPAFQNLPSQVGSHASCSQRRNAVDHLMWSA